MTHSRYRQTTVTTDLSLSTVGKPFDSLLWNSEVLDESSFQLSGSRLEKNLTRNLADKFATFRARHPICDRSNSLPVICEGLP